MTERAKSRLSWAFTAAAFALVVWRYWPAPAEDLGPAPPLVVPTLAGAPFDLAAHRGTTVVVNVWATWCGPCRAELPGFARIARDTPDVVFVAIATDDAGEAVVRPYAEARDLPFAVGLDPGGRAVATLPGGVSTLPTTFVVNAEGRIVARHEGLLVPPALRTLIGRADG